MASVRLVELSKEFDAGGVRSGRGSPVAAPAVDRVSLDIPDGQFTVLVGPSGCGKTTVLRMIAGLEEPTSGQVFIGEREVTHLPPGDRNVAMVFQNYALYPHFTVRDNIAFGLRMRRATKSVIERKVGESAEMLGISELLDRKPAQLSGGQRQRVALARAIVREPLVFLFDEPLSNLDAQVRAHTRAELVRLHRELAVTMVYVTHDQVEAMTMAQRVAVMDRGRVQQVAPPLELYRRPATIFVASFIGSPSINKFAGHVIREGDRSTFVGAMRAGAGVVRAGPAVLAVRAEHLELSAELGDSPATVMLVEPLGPESHVLLRFDDGTEAIARVLGSPSIELGQRLGVRLGAGGALLFGATEGVLLGSAERA